MTKRWIPLCEDIGYITGRHPAAERSSTNGAKSRKTMSEISGTSAAELSFEDTPIDEINVALPSLYQDDTWQPWFARLRREAPVHFCPESEYGPYWSIQTTPFGLPSPYSRLLSMISVQRIYQNALIFREAGKSKHEKIRENHLTAEITNPQVPMTYHVCPMLEPNLSA